MRASEMTKKQLAQYIDYAILKPELSEEEIVTLGKAGVAFGVKTLCINPVYIPLCEPLVAGSDTGICPVTDFPFGTSSTTSRIAQIEEAAKSVYVDEIDIVVNYGKLRSGLYEEVTADLRACAQAAHDCGKQLKVILETDALNEEQIRQGCECIIAAGCDFIKTSTGFLTGHELHGASNETVAIILDQNKGRAKVKGSGGIRTKEHFYELIDMGVDRCGVNCTSVPKLLGE